MRARPRGTGEDCGCKPVAEMLRWIMERISSVVSTVKVNGREFPPDGTGKVQIDLKSVGGQSIVGSGDIPVAAAAEWGNITGTLADQTDLKDALDAKASTSALDDKLDEPETAGTAGQVLKLNSDLEPVWADESGGGLVDWGDIGGTLADQTDLKDALDAKADSADLATVATTGDYDDLLDKPDLSAKLDAPSSEGTAGQVLKLDSNLDPVWADESGGGSVEWGDIGGTLADQTDLANALAAKADSSSLATVATTGDYDDLLDKPTIPAAQIQSDWTQADTDAVDYIKNKPALDFVPFTPPGQSWGVGVTKAYINQNGGASAMWIARDAVQYAIPVRSGSPYFNFKVGTPETDNDCINKAYLDGRFDNENILQAVLSSLYPTDSGTEFSETYKYVIWGMTRTLATGTTNIGASLTVFGKNVTLKSITVANNSPFQRTFTDGSKEKYFDFNITLTIDGVDYSHTPPKRMSLIWTFTD